MTKTLEGRIYAALLAAAQGETNLLDLASDLANGIKHQVHLELEMLEESAREREAVKLEIGVHVGITATKYEGMQGVIVAGNPSYWQVEIPGITHPVYFKPEDLKPFPKASQPKQPQPPQPAFAVGTRVRVSQHYNYMSNATGEVVGSPDWDARAVWVRTDIDDEVHPFPMHQLEPLPAEAAALPEGVTRDASEEAVNYHVPFAGVHSAKFRFHKGDGGGRLKLLDGDTGESSTYLDREDIRNLIAMLQAVDAEIEAQS